MIDPTMYVQSKAAGNETLTYDSDTDTYNVSVKTFDPISGLQTSDQEFDQQISDVDSFIATQQGSVASLQTQIDYLNTQITNAQTMKADFEAVHEE